MFYSLHGSPVSVRSKTEVHTDTSTTPVSVSACETLLKAIYNGLPGRDNDCHTDKQSSKKFTGPAQRDAGRHLLNQSIRQTQTNSDAVGKKPHMPASHVCLKAF